MNNLLNFLLKIKTCRIILIFIQIKIIFDFINKIQLIIFTLILDNDHKTLVKSSKLFKLYLFIRF